MNKKRKAALRKKFRRVRLVATDVDGVKTNDTFVLGIGPRGKRIEFYRFFTGDGIAAKECLRHDIPVVMVTGRKSPTVRRRAKDLKVKCLQGVEDKVAAIEALLKKLGLTWKQVLFIGNDIQDLALLRRAGISAAPANAVKEVRWVVDYISKKKGGRGAFRQTIEKMLKAKGLWKKIIERERTLG